MKLNEIIAAVKKLSPEEQAQFRGWFAKLVASHDDDRSKACCIDVPAAREELEPASLKRD